MAAAGDAHAYFFLCGAPPGPRTEARSAYWVGNEPGTDVSWVAGSDLAIRCTHRSWAAGDHADQMLVATWRKQNNNSSSSSSFGGDDSTADEGGLSHGLDRSGLPSGGGAGAAEWLLESATPWCFNDDFLVKPAQTKQVAYVVEIIDSNRECVARTPLLRPYTDRWFREKLRRQPDLLPVDRFCIGRCGTELLRAQQRLAAVEERNHALEQQLQQLARQMSEIQSENARLRGIADDTVPTDSPFRAFASSPDVSNQGGTSSATEIFYGTSSSPYSEDVSEEVLLLDEAGEEVILAALHNSSAEPTNAPNASVKASDYLASDNGTAWDGLPLDSSLTGDMDIDSHLAVLQDFAPASDFESNGLSRRISSSMPSLWDVLDFGGNYYSPQEFSGSAYPPADCLLAEFDEAECAPNVLDGELQRDMFDTELGAIHTEVQAQQLQFVSRPVAAYERKRAELSLAISEAPPANNSSLTQAYGAVPMLRSVSSKVVYGSDGSGAPSSTRRHALIDPNSSDDDDWSADRQEAARAIPSAYPKNSVPSQDVALERRPKSSLRAAGSRMKEIVSRASMDKRKKARSSGRTGKLHPGSEILPATGSRGSGFGGASGGGGGEFGGGSRSKSVAAMPALTKGGRDRLAGSPSSPMSADGRAPPSLVLSRTASPSIAPSPSVLPTSALTGACAVRSPPPGPAARSPPPGPAARSPPPPPPSSAAPPPGPAARSPPPPPPSSAAPLPPPGGAVPSPAPPPSGDSAVRPAPPRAQRARDMPANPVLPGLGSEHGSSATASQPSHNEDIQLEIRLFSRSLRNSKQWKQIADGTALKSGQHLAFVLSNKSPFTVGVRIVYESSLGCLSRILGSQLDAPLLLRPHCSIRRALGELLVSPDVAGPMSIALRVVAVSVDDTSVRAMVERRAAIERLVSSGPDSVRRVGEVYEETSLKQLFGKMSALNIL